MERNLLDILYFDFFIRSFHGRFKRFCNFQTWPWLDYNYRYSNSYSINDKQEHLYLLIQKVKANTWMRNVNRFRSACILSSHGCPYTSSFVQRAIYLLFYFFCYLAIHICCMVRTALSFKNSHSESKIIKKIILIKAWFALP